MNTQEISRFTTMPHRVTRLKTLLLVVCGWLFVTCVCVAQESPEYRACGDKAKNQMEINSCAADEAKRADAELNRVYSELLVKAKKDALVVSKIKAAERSWIAYRDAYIEAMYPAANKQAAYGSVYPMQVNLLGAKLTRQQIAALNDLLKQHSGTGTDSQ
jgi:uncharacterized protein YecT (DUF1311 family)